MPFGVDIGLCLCILSKADILSQICSHEGKATVYSFIYHSYSNFCSMPCIVLVGRPRVSVFLSADSRNIFVYRRRIGRNRLFLGRSYLFDYGTDSAASSRGVLKD